jgi:guanylate kinase
LNFLQKEYGFVILPFITTRNLRAGEKEMGSEQVSARDFLELEHRGKLFLGVSNQGNLYGYKSSEVCNFLKDGKFVLFEAPANRLVTEVSVLLPNAIKIGVIPPDEFSTNTLSIRNTEKGFEQRLRSLRAAIEVEELRHASAHSRVHVVLPTFGEPEWSCAQVRRIIEKEVSDSAIQSISAPKALI